MNLPTLHRNLGRAFESRQTHGAGRMVFVGLETRRDPSYRWHGLERGGDPRHPFAVFQYTISGRGAYAWPAGTRRLLPQDAFAAIVPSDHAYFLPGDSAEWTFFWFIIRHPYVVSRLAEGVRSPVMAIPPDSRVIRAAARLFVDVCGANFADDLAVEAALFEFLFEYERYSWRQQFPGGERDRLLERTRAVILARISDPILVEDLARPHGMSRSHFSHHFRLQTGLTPARFVTEVRLAEVQHRLTRSRDSLKTIAAATGFADANHLCKVFRRYHHISPGAFRRQIG